MTSLSFNHNNVYGLVCSVSNIPKDCDWKILQVYRPEKFNYIFLDSVEIDLMYRKSKEWVEVDFDKFSYYYALFLLGIDPIQTYINEMNNEQETP